MYQNYECSDEESDYVPSEEEEDYDDNWIPGCEMIQNLDVEFGDWDPNGEFVGQDYSEYFITNQLWDSKEELYEWAKSIGKELSIALIKRTSNPYTISIVCDKFGPERSSRPTVNKDNPDLPVPKIRSSYSKKTKCKFELHGFRMKKESGGIPKPNWALNVVEGCHNHPLTDLSGNAFMGRMTPEQQLFARRWGDGMMGPKQIVSQLRNAYPGNLTTRKQVVNFLYKLQYEDRGELTVTQWSLKFLVENDYVVSPIRDRTTNEVQILFFANKESLHLLKKFPYVVIIDATYKMNKYDMPLVEIVGFTCTHSTFNIAYAFTRAEKTFHYKWIMRKLRGLFEELGVMPMAIMTDCELALMNGIQHVFGHEVQHLLCWVHIKHNIEAHASSVLKTKEMVDAFANQCWALFCSTTEEGYEIRLQQLRLSWKSGLVGYVERQWLTPYKERIVRAWTDHRLHFFTRTTNRVEGMHKVLKDIIGSSRGGFNRVVVRIHHAICSQIDQIKISMNISVNKVPNDFSNQWMPPEIRQIFSRLFHRVSNRCFDMLLASYERILSGDFTDECTDHWVRDCQGLPCVHDIARAIITRTPLVPNDIHDFWKELSWEDATSTSRHRNDNVPMTASEMTIREMFGKLESGTLKQATAYEIAEFYKELENPEQSTMLDPTTEGKETKRGKGRPRGSKNKDKVEPREKSWFEHTRERLAHLGKGSATEKGKASEARGVRRPKKEKGSTSAVVMEFSDMPSQPIPEEESQCEGPVEATVLMGVNFGIDNVDEFWFPYIRFVKDVRPNGHCGYRSLALLLGWKEIEYKRVRHELLAELLDNKEMYEPIRNLCMPDETWNDLVRQVNFTKPNCPEECWFNMLLMGLVFATCYQVGLVLLSWHESTLCLPLRWRTSNSGPPSVDLGIALIGNNDHFVPVLLRNESPLPPTPVLWRQRADESIKWWTSHFEERFNLHRRFRVDSGRHG